MMYSRIVYTSPLYVKITDGIWTFLSRRATTVSSRNKKTVIERDEVDI